MIEIIQQRLDRYNAINAIAEAQAVKEIIQKVALYALWGVRFFSQKLEKLS